MAKVLTNRWAHVFILFILLGAAVYGISTDGKLRQRIHLVVFDSLMQAYPRETTGTVHVVDIDDESLTKIGQWPWSRTVIADLVQELDAMGAKAIAFDGVLAEPDRTSGSLFLNTLAPSTVAELKAQYTESFRDNDQVLADAIKASGKFVGAFSYGSNTKRPRLVSNILATPKTKEEFLKRAHWFDGTALFLPAMEENMAGNGSFMASPEVDSVIRRASLLFTDEKALYPSLSLEALRVSMGDKRPVIKVGPNKDFTETRIDTEHRVIVEPYEIPVDESGKIWIHFRKFQKEGNYTSVFKVLDPAYEDHVRKAVEGKIVFIGSSAEGLLDLRSTPQGLIPGVEIHVNAIEQIESKHYLLRPQIAEDAENNFILLVGLLLIVLAPFINVAWLALMCIGLVGGAFFVSFEGFMTYGVLLDPVYPSFVTILIFITSSVFSYIRSETEKRQVRQAFGLYISPHFMEELTKDPDKLKLGGEVKDLTVMFTDIRSFTTISEALTPEDLIQLMNDFLTPMSDLVMSNRGTIDKYMGDAMMAFWNAPLDDADHARHACLAALKMNEALVPINARVKEKADRDGRKPVLLQAGIGLNTGPCSVGNMGSRQRFAYSALGDAVNLASRLEGQTKTYGVTILCGEETQKQAAGLAWLELDLLRVKGKTEPVRVFTLLGDETVAGSEDFKKWQAAHNGMIAAYRIADLDCAAQDIKDAADAAKGQLKAYYDLYMQRIITLMKNPPGTDWDGVWTAESK